jgi:hypothetical protein
MLSKLCHHVWSPIKSQMQINKSRTFDKAKDSKNKYVNDCKNLKFKLGIFHGNINIK